MGNLKARLWTRTETSSAETGSSATIGRRAMSSTRASPMRWYRAPEHSWRAGSAPARRKPRRATSRFVFGRSGLCRDTAVMSGFATPSPRGHQVPPFRVLMVCTGNVHRSPLAERLLTARLGRYREAFRVTSAGTAARTGTPMDPVAVALLTGLGGDPRDARASRLTVERVENADLVLGASTEHRDAAVRLSPVWALRRAFTLREFARLLRAEDAAGSAGPAERAVALVSGAWARRGKEGHAGDDDVADPYGAPVEVARWCAGRIAESVERIAVAVRG